MNPFQMIVVPFMFLCSVRCAWKGVRSPSFRARLGNGLLALAWAAGGVLVIDPELTSVLAQAFGIGRGVDLVFYIFMVLAFWYAIIIYYRLSDLRKDITLIVRHLALAERQLPAEKEQVESKDGRSAPKQ